MSLHTRSMFALEVWQCHTLSNRVKALNPFCPYCQLRISARVVVYLMRRRVWRVIITQRILPSLLPTIPPRRSIIKQSDFNFSFWRGKNLGVLKLVLQTTIQNPELNSVGVLQSSYYYKPILVYFW